MTNEELTDALCRLKSDAVCYIPRFEKEYKEALDAAIEKIEETTWNLVSFREMTEEDNYTEFESAYIYDCKLPDNGDEVLISTKYNTVEKTTFYDDYGCYFEDYEDVDEVKAWKSLPKPYKER